MYRPGLSRNAFTLDTRVKLRFSPALMPWRRNTTPMRAKLALPRTFTSKTAVVAGPSPTESIVKDGSNQDPCSKMPALETAWCIWPNLSWADLKSLYRSSYLVTSQCWKEILPCCDPLESDDTSASAGSVAISPKKMFAPDLTSSVAVAAPMPVAALDRVLAGVVRATMESPLPCHHNILALQACECFFVRHE